MTAPTVTQPRPIEGLSEIIGAYRFVISDLWGVLHDGAVAHRPAADCLARLRGAGMPVVLLSNAPKPSAVVRAHLGRLGIDDGLYDALVTSGDLARRFMASRAPAEAYFHLGPARDAPTLEGLAQRPVDTPEAADLVLCTGLFEDPEHAAPADHDAVLRRARARDLTLVCANPDRVVQAGDRLVACAGALADRYEAMGGAVAWLGKPQPVAYEACFAAMAHRGEPVPRPDEVLVIGDSLVTDIAGAAAMGFASVLVADGIHGEQLLPAAPGPVRLDRIPAHGPQPTAVIGRLRWSGDV